MAAPNNPFRRYPPEMRERAIRMVRESIAESGERQGAVSRVARQLGIGTESLRNWVKQADIDTGKRPGMTTTEQRRIAELERDNRELRRANEILRPPRLSLRGSSTRDCRSRELSQHAPRALGDRADLPNAAGRPVHVLRGRLSA